MTKPPASNGRGLLHWAEMTGWAGLAGQDHVHQGELAPVDGGEGAFQGGLEFSRVLHPFAVTAEGRNQLCIIGTRNVYAVVDSSSGGDPSGKNCRWELCIAAYLPLLNTTIIMGMFSAADTPRLWVTGL